MCREHVLNFTELTGQDVGLMPWLFSGVSHASVPWFCCKVGLLGFVVRQTCILEWSLIYRGLPYFFLHLHSPTGVNYLITNFVPLLCPYQYEDMDLLVFFDCYIPTV